MLTKSRSNGCRLRPDPAKRRRGHHVSFLREGLTVIVLCAGDKSSQERDIERAKMLAEDWRQR